MAKKLLSRVSYIVTGGLLLVIACSEDTGTSQLPTGTAGSAGVPATGGAGAVTGGSSGAGGSAGTVNGKAGSGGSAGSATGGTAGTMPNDDEAECGNQPMPGDTCTGAGQCDGSRRCSCTNGVVTGQTCGQQFQQQGNNNGGAGGMAPGGIDCGASPSNGDDCPAPGVCRSGMGCQCAAGLLTVYGCTSDGGGGEGTGEGGMGPSGGSSGRGGSSGNGGNGGNAGTAGAGTSGASSGGPVNCGQNPETGEPCTRGPGVCPNDDTCICTAPPNGMVQCQ